MRLNDLHKEVIEKLNELKEKEISREDYQRWCEDPLTKYMKLQLEEIIYRTYKGQAIEWPNALEALLYNEPAIVAKEGE